MDSNTITLFDCYNFKCIGMINKNDIPTSVIDNLKDETKCNYNLLKLTHVIIECLCNGQSKKIEIDLKGNDFILQIFPNIQIFNPKFIYFEHINCVEIFKNKVYISRV